MISLHDRQILRAPDRRELPAHEGRPPAAEPGRSRSGVLESFPIGSTRPACMDSGQPHPYGTRPPE